MEKIDVLGNQMPSGHSAGRIINPDGIAPTVMENHGTVTKIASDEPRCEVVGMLDIDGHDFCRRVHSADGVSPTIPFCGGGGQEPKIIDVEEGGAFNFSFPRSETRRGRVQDGGAVAPALMAKNQEIGTVERVETAYRVRKLTERECWRLMGVKDEDFDKVNGGQSRSSMYHLAGDSIVTAVLMALYGELFGVEWKDKVRGLWNDE